MFCSFQGDAQSRVNTQPTNHALPSAGMLILGRCALAQGARVQAACGHLCAAPISRRSLFSHCDCAQVAEKAQKLQTYLSEVKVTIVVVPMTGDLDIQTDVIDVMHTCHALLALCKSCSWPYVPWLKGGCKGGRNRRNVHTARMVCAAFTVLDLVGAW